MSVWYTADLHFGHENVIKYCNRPWISAQKMDRGLIANWNKVVANEDTVYVLGDFGLHGPERWRQLARISQMLNGDKHLILGNHDKLDPFLYMECGFKNVHLWLEMPDWYLVHDPAWAIMFPGKPVLCGHIHTVFKKSTNGRILNVGTDQWGYFPASEWEVMDALGIKDLKEGT